MKTAAPELRVGQPVRWQGLEGEIYTFLPGLTHATLELEDGEFVDAPVLELELLNCVLAPLPDLSELDCVPVRSTGPTMSGGMRVVTVVNNAGGVGKTSLSLNIGYELAQQGLKVLLIDMDSQANLTSWLGIRDAEEEETIHSVIVSGKAPLPRPRRVYGLDVIPSTRVLAITEALTISAGLVKRVRERLDEVRGHWDLVIFDSPPSLGALMGLGAVASDGLIVPLSTNAKGIEALEGIQEALETYRIHNPGLEIKMFVPTMYDSRRSGDREKLEQIKAAIPAHLLATEIPQRQSAWDRAAEEGRPLTLSAPHSPAAQDVRRVAQEVAQTLGIELDGSLRTGTQKGADA